MAGQAYMDSEVAYCEKRNPIPKMSVSWTCIDSVSAADFAVVIGWDIDPEIYNFKFGGPYDFSSRYGQRKPCRRIDPDTNEQCSVEVIHDRNSIFCLCAEHEKERVEKHNEYHDADDERVYYEKIGDIFMAAHWIGHQLRLRDAYESQYQFRPELKHQA